MNINDADHLGNAITGEQRCDRAVFTIVLAFFCLAKKSSSSELVFFQACLRQRRHFSVPEHSVLFINSCFFGSFGPTDSPYVDGTYAELKHCVFVCVCEPLCLLYLQPNSVPSPVRPLVYRYPCHGGLWKNGRHCHRSQLPDRNHLHVTGGRRGRRRRRGERGEEERKREEEGEEKYATLLFGVLPSLSGRLTRF